MRAVVALVGTLLFVATSCGGGASEKELEFRVYDPMGMVQTELTSADIVRRSAAAGPGHGGDGTLELALTDTGASKLCRLTRSLARRGRALGELQSFVVEVNGRELARPDLDHEATPDGICGAPGIQVNGIPLEYALALADEIRG
jgi:hypothetical protein